MLQGLLFLQTFIIPIHFLKSAPFADFSNRNLNKFNILFENRRIFLGSTMWEIKKPWDMSKIPISQGFIFSFGR